MTTQNTEESLTAFNPNNPNNDPVEEHLPDQRVLDAQQDRGLGDAAQLIPGTGQLGQAEKETNAAPPDGGGVAGSSGSFHDTGPAGGARVGTGGAASTGGATGGGITGNAASDGGRISDPA